MHPRLSVSAISSFGWSLDEDLAFYATHGIDHVGISIAKLERAGWDDGVAAVAAAGLRVGNVIGIGTARLDDESAWPAQRSRLLRAVDAADQLEAGCVVLTTGPAGALTWDDAARALGEELAPVLARARDRNVRVALEHTNSLRVDVGFVHTLRDALDLAAELDVAVCIEINACWAERGLAATVRSGVDRLALVQVSDYAIGTLRTPDRLVPGDGDIPLERILGEVLGAGYAGAFDIELIGPRIEAEGYAGAIPRAIDRLSALLDRLGA